MFEERVTTRGAAFTARVSMENVFILQMKALHAIFIDTVISARLLISQHWLQIRYRHREAFCFDKSIKISSVKVEKRI